MIPLWVPWVACGVLAIGGYALHERGVANLAACESRMDKFKQELATKALQQRAEVAEASAKAAHDMLVETRQVEATASNEKEKVRVVTVTLPCQQDPGIGAMFDAVDRVLGPAAGPGADQGPGRPVPLGAVPGSGAAVPR